MSAIRIPFKGVAPVFSSAEAAGADLTADGSALLRPGQTVLVGTGTRVAIPEGYVGMLHLRSSLSARGILLAVGCGVIDSDYRGELRVPLVNVGQQNRIIAPGDRIAQLVILKLPDVEYVAASMLPGTARGEGGFGSTGR